MELTYHWEGDVRILDLEAPEAPKIGKYGMLRDSYLLKHKKPIRTVMLLEGTLNTHLEEVDHAATEMMDTLVSQMAKAEGITEEIKARDQFSWIGAMNGIRERAEEVVLRELVYV